MTREKLEEAYKLSKTIDALESMSELLSDNIVIVIRTSGTSCSVCLSNEEHIRIVGSCFKVIKQDCEIQLQKL